MHKNNKITKAESLFSHHNQRTEHNKTNSAQQWEAIRNPNKEKHTIPN